MRSIFAAIGSIALTTAIHGSVLDFSRSLDAFIPDNNPTGKADSILVSAGNEIVSQVEVILTISGGFNGDYYAQLNHEESGSFSVLLNRVGARPGQPSGYSDSGISIMFADSAPNDIHSYRLALFGDHVTSAPTPLTGAWQPDARPFSLSQSENPNDRIQSLSAFSGILASGKWTLFVADLKGGDIGKLLEWNLSITTVPEPAQSTCLGAGLLGAWALARRRRKESHRDGRV